MDTSLKFVAAFALVFLLLVVGSVLFENYRSETQSYPYNGFEFALAGSGADTVWVTQIQVNGQVYNVPFYYHPSEVEDVFFEEGIAEGITDSPVKPNIVYMTFDPLGGARPIIAGVEISRILGTKYDLLNLNVQSALTAPDPNAQTDNLIKTCDDAVDGVLVIEFANGTTNSVSNEGNCVQVRYTSPEDSIRVADRFAYGLLKIM